MLCEPAKFDSGLSSHLHLFFNSPSPGAQWSVSFFRWCPFENRKAIYVHAVNMDKTSPSSLLYLIIYLIAAPNIFSGFFCGTFMKTSETWDLYVSEAYSIVLNTRWICMFLKRIVLNTHWICLFMKRTL